MRKCLRPFTFLLISRLLIEDMRLLQDCTALMRKHEKQCVLLASEVEGIETRNHVASLIEDCALQGFEFVLHGVYYGLVIGSDWFLSFAFGAFALSQTLNLFDHISERGLEPRMIAKFKL